MDQQKQRRYFTPEQKLQVVLESIQRDTTLEAVSRKYNIVASVIIRWRREFKEKAAIERMLEEKRGNTLINA